MPKCQEIPLILYYRSNDRCGKVRYALFRNQRKERTKEMQTMKILMSSYYLYLLLLLSSKVLLSCGKAPVKQRHS